MFDKVRIRSKYLTFFKTKHIATRLEGGSKHGRNISSLSINKRKRSGKR